MTNFKTINWNLDDYGLCVNFAYFFAESRFQKVKMDKINVQNQKVKLTFGKK